jgi:hypothetical protein
MASTLLVTKTAQASVFMFPPAPRDAPIFMPLGSLRQVLGVTLSLGLCSTEQTGITLPGCDVGAVGNWPAVVVP